jgi:hypothetical protein
MILGRDILNALRTISEATKDQLAAATAELIELRKAETGGGSVPRVPEYMFDGAHHVPDDREVPRGRPFSASGGSTSEMTQTYSNPAPQLDRGTSSANTLGELLEDLRSGDRDRIEKASARIAGALSGNGPPIVGDLRDLFGALMRSTVPPAAAAMAKAEPLVAGIARAIDLDDNLGTMDVMKAHAALSRVRQAYAGNVEFAAVKAELASLPCEIKRHFAAFAQ